MENYVASKFQLVANMKPDQHFVYSAQDPVLTSARLKFPTPARPVGVALTKSPEAAVFAEGNEMHFRLTQPEWTVPQADTTLKGPHNLINTMCAVSAALLAGVSVSSIRASLKTFKNAPHRLESVGVVDGVEFVNDSKATNVDSVVYALGSFKQPLVWIAGGIDKGNDYNLIKAAVQRQVHTLICLGKDNQKLVQFFTGVVPQVCETQSVPELIQIALRVAKPGDVVLLSPACASFDLFKNYEDRGHQFREAVQQVIADRRNETIQTTH
jgi:UDP-N-acetylmuramoylalanine--D-glutamate ligase